MKILSVNAGSSSLKFTMFEMPEENVIINGTFEKIGLEGSFYSIKYNGEKTKKEAVLKDHTDAVKILLEKLVDLGIIQSLSEINGVGHRLVHGKDKYTESVIITDEVIEDLEKFKDFAPLHNPANILGIEAVKKASDEI